MDSTDSIKNAFTKVKQDIDYLSSELINLKEDLRETRQEMVKIVEILRELTENTLKKQQKTQDIQQITPIITPYTPTHNPALQQINSTTPTYNPTDNLPLKPLKPPYLPISTGNQGVPTDRQTDRQTDASPTNQHAFQQNMQQIPIKSPYSINSIDDAARILDSLDSLKKEIRRKFKQLTDQEILVFSTLYQLEEEQGPIEYKVLASKLNLTESSIRDYIGRLLKKGIPIDKKRINNKQILISVSPNLKKVATLSTILQLRDI